MTFNPSKYPETHQPVTYFGPEPKFKNHSLRHYIFDEIKQTKVLKTKQNEFLLYFSSSSVSVLLYLCPSPVACLGHSDEDGEE